LDDGSFRSLRLPRKVVCSLAWAICTTTLYFPFCEAPPDESETF
jgi:hypothetical protein